MQQEFVTQFQYAMTAGDVAVSRLILFISLSLWALFLVWLMRQKND